MIVHDEFFIPSSVADLVTSSYAHTARAPGWHVSGLVRAGHQLAGGKVYADTEEDNGLAAMGRLWEHVVRDLLKRELDYHFIPDVQDELDGIHANLDGLLYPLDGSPPLVQETKLKFSPIKPLTDYWTDMHQVRAYCYMTHVNRALMIIGEITSKPPKVRMLHRMIEFTNQELVETWVMLNNVRDYLIKQGVQPS